MLHTFFVFRNGKVISVVQSTVDDYESAIDGDYTVKGLVDVEKQIAQWKSEHQ